MLSFSLISTHIEEVTTDYLVLSKLLKKFFVYYLI